MPEIVTLSEARDYLRFTDDERWHDAKIETMVAAATEAVLALADDWDGEGDPPARLKIAVLTRVGNMFDQGSLEAAKGEDRLLSPFRKLEL